MFALRALLKQKDANSSTAGRSGAAEAEDPGASGDPTQLATVCETAMGEERGIPKRKGSSPTLSDNPGSVSLLNNAAADSMQRRYPTVSESEEAIPRNRKDVVDKGLLSMDTARQLLELYKTELYPFYPIVYITPACTADDLRRTKPTLFLAIVAAAAGKKYPDVAMQLDQEVLQEYANRTVVNSEKSLELAESLLVSSVWYQPPGRLAQLKYYEYIHMAAIMVADIGIGTRRLKGEWMALASKNSALCSNPSANVSNPDFNMRMRMRNLEVEDGVTSIESRRTFLATHSTSAGVIITLRRPAMMRTTSYTRECLDYLEQSPHAAPGDCILTAWTRLLMIADEISTAFAYDDPGAIASIVDVKTQLMIGAFEKRLTEWRRSVAEQNFSPTLRITYYTTRLHLHEIVLHVDHSSEDFKAPYHMGGIYPHEAEQVPVKPVVDALAELVESTHALMDVFMGIDVNRTRALPVFSFVRLSYAAFILAKLCVSAASTHGQLAPLIDRSSLKAESYMERTLDHLRGAIGPNGCRVPAIFFNLLSQMGQWCSHPELIQQAEMEGGMRESGLEDVPRLVEDVSSPNTTPETTGGGSSSMSATLTGSWENNYESYAGDEAVMHTAVGGQASQAISTPKFHAQFDTPLPGEKEEDQMIFDQYASKPSTLAPGETTAAMYSDAQEHPWPLELNQMDWDSDIFSFLQTMDPSVSDPAGPDDFAVDMTMSAQIDHANDHQPTKTGDEAAG